jgi:hypothetical protein
LPSAVRTFGLNDSNLKSTLMDTAINSTIKASPANPILFYQNTKR